MRVCIVGCGYVGLALAEQLIADGHEVAGVRRDADAVREAVPDAEAVAADVTDPESLTALPDADAVVFAASSGGRGATAARAVFVEGLWNVIREYGERTDPPDRLVYTSSTGVYGDHDGDWVDESTPLDPQTEKTEVLVEAERIAVETAAEYGIDGTVARFAGLYGPDRYRTARYVEGPVTEGYLNMVHRDDAAGAVRFLLTDRSLDPDPAVASADDADEATASGEADDAEAPSDGDEPLETPADYARGEVVLVVDDEPVEKWAFADWLADECGVARPEKRTTADRLAAGDLSAAAERRIQTSKRCDNAYLRESGYAFRYPTYREGYRDAIAAYRERTE
ncbi:NAD-dependent epimerase/dehydratase family protein [Halobaculum sp. MBLA0147]|uniref:NAD-dependent epimerase/dehydratase family protein n=1 Tax=Halobaculum sp. MBLA0147 TaxID=3079934 RepID=UPI003525D505